MRSELVQLSADAKRIQAILSKKTDTFGMFKCYYLFLNTVSVQGDSSPAFIANKQFTV